MSDKLFDKKSSSDQQKIRKEKWSKLFPSSFFAILFLLISFIYWVSKESDRGWLMIFFCFCSIVIGIIAFIFFTKKVNQDLEMSEISLIKTMVEMKHHIIDYEVGSGSLYIPILGDIFPKAFGQEMREIEYFQIRLNHEKYDVSKDIYDTIEKDDFVYIRQSINSGIFLGIELISKNA